MPATGLMNYHKIMEYMIQSLPLQLFKDHLTQTMISSPLISDHNLNYTQAPTTITNKELYYQLPFDQPENVMDITSCI